VVRWCRVRGGHLAAADACHHEVGGGCQISVPLARVAAEGRPIVRFFRRVHCIVVGHGSGRGVCPLQENGAGRYHLPLDGVGYALLAWNRRRRLPVGVLLHQQLLRLVPQGATRDIAPAPQRHR